MVTLNTLAEAQKYVQDHRHDGTTCPCCDQFVKVYRRTITSTMARGLIELYRAVQDSNEYVHLETLAGNDARRVRVWRGDFTKLRFWNFIEPQPLDSNAGDEKKDAGVWRLLDQGRQFARGEIMIASHAYVFNNTVLEYEQKSQITIHDALGKNFDYGKLMKGEL